MNATLKKPLAVVRQAQAAEAAIAAMNGHPDPVQVEEPLVVAAPVPDGAEADADEVAPATQQQVAADPAPAPTPDLAAEFARLQQAHTVLQGKYNAEGQRDRATIDGLRRDLDSLRSLVASLQAKPAPAADTPPVAKPLVTAKEIEDFGEDLLDAAARFAAQQWKPVVDKLQAELATLRADVTTAKTTASAAQNTIAMSARERMFALLDKEVTDWRTVNTDDAFKNWLAQEDEMSGETRQALLLKAYEKNDGPRVLRFFARYKAENTQNPAPAPSAAPAAAPPVASNTRVDPAALVAPSRGRSAPRPAGAQQIIWTPEDIARFYSEVQRGLYKNKPDEQHRLEQDIFASQREGRVQT